MILATDMGKHFDILGQFRVKLMNSSVQVLESLENRIDVMKLSAKAADIGHASKIKELHERWSLLVIEEFFNQGDIEKAKNHPISMYCDRDKPEIAKSQAGFLKNIVMPLYESLNHFLQSSYIENNCINQIKKNLKNWENGATRKRGRVNTHVKNPPKSEFDKLAKKFTPLRRGSTIVVKNGSDEEKSWAG